LTKGRERYGIETPTFNEGTVANLTLFDPALTYTFEKENILSTSQNSMFINNSMKGTVLGVICNNQSII